MATDPYAAEPYAADSYTADRYAADPYAADPYAALPTRRPGVAFLAAPDPAAGPVGPPPELPAASGAPGPDVMLLQKVLRGLRSMH
jgi:hypothetical protein